MIILTDTREQRPYSFETYQAITEAAALAAGDYSLKGFQDRVAVERKSLNDLVGCLTGKDRTRFEKELARAGSFERFCVMVEASLQDVAAKRYRSAMEHFPPFLCITPITDVAAGRYTSNMKPHAVLQSIMAFYIRYGIPFLFCGARAGAEYVTHSILSKYAYEVEKRYRMLAKVG